ncbi:SMI1/KNR4 family protein [Streptomyces sp. NPDC001068]|uniref:SMI1/KNR4 family protein n=1 Tax=Streptomyces sp. NPDC001068 TaxID=3364544 RepID=UPI0036857EAB
MTRMDLPAFEREWTSFESWLQANSPAIHSMSRRPAAPELLIVLQSRLGFELHPEFKALLGQHGGAAEPGCAKARRAFLLGQCVLLAEGPQEQRPTGASGCDVVGVAAVTG